MSSHIRRLEEELAEAKAAAATFEADLQGALSRLNAVEQQYTSEQLENNKLRSEIDSLKRQIDVLKVTFHSLITKSIKSFKLFKSSEILKK